MKSTIHSRARITTLVSVALLVASMTSLVACSGTSIDDQRSDLRRQLTEVGGLTEEQQRCMTDLVDGLSDAEVEELAAASESGGAPDMTDTTVADFVNGTQECVVNAASIKDLVLDSLPLDLDPDERARIENVIDEMDDETLESMATGDPEELADALFAVAPGG